MIGGTRFVAAPRNATLDQIANEDFSRRRLRRNFHYHKVFLINSISRKYSGAGRDAAVNFRGQSAQEAAATDRFVL
jgi:hypothetical protein